MSTVIQTSRLSLPPSPLPPLRPYLCVLELGPQYFVQDHEVRVSLLAHPLLVSVADPHDVHNILLREATAPVRSDVGVDDADQESRESHDLCWRAEIEQEVLSTRLDGKKVLIRWESTRSRFVSQSVGRDGGDGAGRYNCQVATCQQAADSIPHWMGENIDFSGALYTYSCNNNSIWNIKHNVSSAMCIYCTILPSQFSSTKNGLLLLSCICHIVYHIYHSFYRYLCPRLSLPPTHFLSLYICVSISLPLPCHRHPGTGFCHVYVRESISGKNFDYRPKLNNVLNAK